MNDREIAMKAIKEAMQLLRMVDNLDKGMMWKSHSIPRHELDCLAQELGYRDAVEIEGMVLDAEESSREAFLGEWHDLF